jgi:hypothetical protein
MLAPSRSSSAPPLAFTTCLNPCTVDHPAPIDGHRFQLAPMMGRFLSLDSNANISNDKGFPFLRKFLAHPKLLIHLTFDNDDDDDDEADATELGKLA